jgi:hypothetical protein
MSEIIHEAMNFKAGKVFTAASPVTTRRELVYTGLVGRGVAGEDIDIGEAVYFDATAGEWKLIDADAAATMPCRALALSAAGDGEDIDLLFYGYIRNDAWAFTAGANVYGSTTAGGITKTAPSGSGDQVQIVGFAIDTDEMLFNPCYALTEVT